MFQLCNDGLIRARSEGLFVRQIPLAQNVESLDDDGLVIHGCNKKDKLVIFSIFI